nr:MAG TPA: hypothetical protein [Bacteriophage sp.]
MLSSSDCIFLSVVSESAFRILTKSSIALSVLNSCVGRGFPNISAYRSSNT